MPTIAVQSRELAADLDLLELPIANEALDNAWLLFRDDHGLALRRADNVRVAPEFVNGRAAARAREASLAGQPLARALGIARLASRHDGPVSLVDATAGFGVDAWQAAALGADVTMIEQHPVVHALLNDALDRARSCEDARVQALVQRVRLHRANAIPWLQQLADEPVAARPMIVYLDPMYPAPESRRRARSRKGIESLHALIPAGGDDGLLEAALAAATQRVVVKRPTGAPHLPHPHRLYPDAINAPNTRWDRYLASP